LTICPTEAEKTETVVAIFVVVAGAVKGGGRIENPPQVKNLPHN
jgi:hypothetical protein